MRARNLVIATGGHQPLDRLVSQTVAGEPLVARVGDRLLQSDEVLKLGGLARVADLLDGKRSPRVTVIGGSTSALTRAVLSMNRTLALADRGANARSMATSGRNMRIRIIKGGTPALLAGTCRCG